MTSMSIDIHKFRADQIVGLLQLSKALGRYEINAVMRTPGSDMGYVELLDTPHGPHAIFDPHTKSYDIWQWGRKRPAMKEINLSIDDAVEILATKYFIAKAKRVCKQHPDKSMKEIIQFLRRGYQRGQTDKDDIKQH